MRVFACFLSAWGLLIAPELCLAGWLVSCSADEECGTLCDCAGAACGQAQHECGGSEDCCECLGACALVSTAPAKTPACEWTPLPVPLPFDIPDSNDFNCASSVSFLLWFEAPAACYPRPPSDRPLRI